MEISLEQYNKMAERLAELEYLLAEQQWTPSDERPPKRDGKYLVTTPKYKLVRVREFSLKYWWEDGTPLAWMPLPKPYGGENDE